MRRRGAIFDWDGVIVDSSRHHEESWVRLASELGEALPEGFFLKSFGMRNEQIIPSMLGWATEVGAIAEVSLRKEVLYREIVEEWGIEPLPGVRPWVDALHRAGIPCVIASSTQRANIELSLESFGLRSAFGGIVSSEDVSLGKPDPEVFVCASNLIDVLVEHCVVFEDAPVGIQAGCAAGMTVVGLTTTHPGETLNGADHIAERLDQLQIESLWPDL